MEESKIKTYFMNQLNDKNSTISKDDILNLALECGLDLKPRTAKNKIIGNIIENGFYDKLFEYFNEFITVPAWDVADYYGMSTNKINQLKIIGVIKEETISKEFYSRRDKEYFKADTYPLSVFNYSSEELTKAYDNAFGGDSYALRIETKTEEETKQLSNVLEKIFKMDKVPNTYEHRNNDGYFTYYKIKLLNYSKEEENKLLAEIIQLKSEKEKMRQEHKEHVDFMLKTFKKYLGDDLDRFNLEDKLSKLIGKDL